MAKWTAEKCGIKYYCTGRSLYYGDDEAVDAMNNGKIPVLDRADICRGLIQWTMHDARCREVVEDFFKIELFYVDGELHIIARPAFNMNRKLWGEGCARKIASINCIAAIMKADGVHD